jgi:CubicO group peptidase (beta-lactamase class C family)/tetratricopeptide (TPR) repeat protein
MLGADRTAACFVAVTIVACLIAGTLPAAAADGHYDGAIEEIRTFVRQEMAVERIPGLTIGFQKDDFVWVEGFGFADLENQVPAGERSAYRLASNTKSMVAVAVLQLAEQGKIDLDAEVQTYVPYFPRGPWLVTVRQLLGHLGGISHYQDYDAEGHIKEHKRTRDALAIFADFEPVARSGSRFVYSSYGYNLAGAVVEAAARQPFGEYMQQQLWQPLGMNDTVIDLPNPIIANRVSGYRLVDGELVNSEYVDISSRFAAGGTRSTVPDLLAYADGLRSTKVLGGESLELLHTSLTTRDGHLTDYALGWVVTPVNGYFVALHTGGQPETRTMLIRFPQQGLAIAMAYNFEGGNLRFIASRVAQILLGMPWNLPVTTGDPVGDTLYQGLWDTFSYGLAHLDRHGEPRISDPDELADAFATFNRLVDLSSLREDLKGASQRLRDGRHPVGNQIMVTVGSHMASLLTEGAAVKRRAQLHAGGAIPFFAAYIDAYRNRPGVPPELRFNESLEQLIDSWHRDWQQTCTPYLQQLAITSGSDLSAIGSKLTELFDGAVVRPDLTPDLQRVARQACLNEEKRQAQQAAQLAVKLYPESVTAMTALAEVLACTGKTEQAVEVLSTARELARGNSSAARSLNRFAGDLIVYGHSDQAMVLLEVAAKVYPDAAELYESMASIHLHQAINLCERALAANPSSESAWRLLNKLER